MSVATIPAIAALRLRHSRKAFIDAFQAMPAEKQDWKPTLPDGKGRSARQLVEECVLTNTTFAEMIRSGVEPDIDWVGELTKLGAVESGALVEQFRAGNEALAVLLESLTDDHLVRTFLWPWAEREVSFAEFAFMPAWHLDYHAGQINYIQTLYGDDDHHSPPA
jgi:hypothetical protein